MKQGLNFGIAAVQSGQKSSTLNAEPQLIVNSTPGKFTITSPVSKALMIAVGENVVFYNNIAGVELALQQKNADLLQYATENNLDIDNAADAEALVAAFTQWYIGKGVAEFNANGTPKMCTVRFTAEDKEAWLADNKEKFITENIAAFAEKYGTDDVAALMDKVSADDVPSPQTQSFTGSKTATTSSATGIGCQLGFTDSAIWNSLKKELDEEGKKCNRIFNVDLNNAVTIQVNNGKSMVDTTIYPITFIEDKEPIIRTKKDESESAE